MKKEETQNVLITGGARRIGAAIATVLAADGWTIGIHYNESEKPAKDLCSTLRNSGNQAYTVQANFKKIEETDKVIDLAIERGGPITCLINNASIFEQDDVSNLSQESWEKHIGINLWTPVRLSQNFQRNLPNDQKGNIVNIVDQRSINLSPGFLSYTASKAGLWAITQTLALSLAPRIRVNAIGPGPTLPSPRQTKEQFSKQASHMPLGRGPSVKEIAEGVRYILASRSLTGQLIALDGGQHLGWDFPRKDCSGIE